MIISSPGGDDFEVEIKTEKKSQSDESVVAVLEDIVGRLGRLGIWFGTGEIQGQGRPEKKEEGHWHNREAKEVGDTETEEASQEGRSKMGFIFFKVFKCPAGEPDDD